MPISLVASELTPKKETVVVKVLKESGNIFNGSKNSLPKLLTPFPVLPATMQHALLQIVVVGRRLKIPSW